MSRATRLAAAAALCDAVAARAAAPDTVTLAPADFAKVVESAVARIAGSIAAARRERR